MIRALSVLLMAFGMPALAQESAPTEPQQDQIWHQSDNMVYGDEEGLSLSQELKDILKEESDLQNVQWGRTRVCWARNRVGRVFSGSGPNIHRARRAAMLRCAVVSSGCAVRNCR